MPFIHHIVQPILLSRRSRNDPTTVSNSNSNNNNNNNKPNLSEAELETVTNVTLTNALRQLASLVLIADAIFGDLRQQLHQVASRSSNLQRRIHEVHQHIGTFDPKAVPVPEGDLSWFASRTEHYRSKSPPRCLSLLTAATRPEAVRRLYEAAGRAAEESRRHTDDALSDRRHQKQQQRQADAHGSEDLLDDATLIRLIETRTPASVLSLRRCTSAEALGDVTVGPDCTLVPRAAASVSSVRLPSPEEQQHAIVAHFPPSLIPVDVTGRPFRRQSSLRRSLCHPDDLTTIKGSSADRTGAGGGGDGDHGGEVKRRGRSGGRRNGRSRRRNTLAGTDHREIIEQALQGEPSLAVSPTESGPDDAINPYPLPVTSATTTRRTASSDLLKSISPKAHFNSLKAWGKKNKLLRFIKKGGGGGETKSPDSPEDNVYETIRRNKTTQTQTSGVKLRETSTQLRQTRRIAGKEEHSSSGNWSASSESGRASIASETTHAPRSTTPSSTQHGSVSSRRRVLNTSTSSSHSEGTLTPDLAMIGNDGDSSSVYSCDTEGYYTSFHVDSGLKTLKEEDLTPVNALHTSCALSASRTLVENEYELFGKGSTSTTASSAGTVCTTLLAQQSAPTPPERTSSLERKLKRNEKTTKVTPPERTCSLDRNSDKVQVQVQVQVHEAEQDKSEPPESDSEVVTERLRVKTSINASRIPSMCVITPPVSDSDDGGSEQALTRSHLTTSGVGVGGGGPSTGDYMAYSPPDAIEQLYTKIDKRNKTRRKLDESDNDASRDSGGDYVTIAADCLVPDVCTTTTPSLVVDIPQEFVPLNDLPSTPLSPSSLERRRAGARVTLDSQGNVIYASESLERRRRGPSVTKSTFEPGPCLKPTSANTESPLLASRRVLKPIRPVVTNANRVIIRAGQPTKELPPRSPGAYVHMQPPLAAPLIPSDADSDERDGEDPLYASITKHQQPQQVARQHALYASVRGNGGGHSKMTPPLPAQIPQVPSTIRPLTTTTTTTTTPTSRSFLHSTPNNSISESMGMEIFSPISVNNVSTTTTTTVANNNKHNNNNNKPRQQVFKLEPKSKMSAEEIFAAIHKSKKRLNINEKKESGPSNEAGSRNSWSPSNPDSASRPAAVSGAGSRQSWACDRLGPVQPTTRLAFKQLLLQQGSKSQPLGSSPVSAVEQLRASKNTPPPNPLPPPPPITPPTSHLHHHYHHHRIHSPRSPWRLMSPRSEILSSTIPEEEEKSASPPERTPAHVVLNRHVRRPLEIEFNRQVEQEQLSPSNIKENFNTLQIQEPPNNHPKRATHINSTYPFYNNNNNRNNNNNNITADAKLTMKLARQRFFQNNTISSSTTTTTTAPAAATLQITNTRSALTPLDRCSPSKFSLETAL